ncbi:Binding-protein-dependent transport system inner membrane component [Polaromonas sp. OV174]|uniref:ABC transporter permease subunit n=1 Tax=Polaromonas sp. OV174 TaxID=1855300 RepID=UPI0008E5976C|nr:ABC transporter permease subunit [Polaromonas sp. OV174]SFC07457.1 Binding-protein-dependent transport system inner membrane component [Polaromonas sp. OV174]
MANEARLNHSHRDMASGSSARADARRRRIIQATGAAGLGPFILPRAHAANRTLKYPSFTVAFRTWLMMGFFKAVPRDIEEAAMMDGLRRFGAFLQVVVPLASVGMLTVVISTLTLVMQEFVYALTFITRSSRYTVSVGAVK